MRPAGSSTGMRFTGAASVGARSGAVLSPDRVYRYSLTRRWGDENRFALWVMLNPSTADATEDDATVRRCRNLTREAGFDAFVAVNLFALRSNDPTRLIGHHDPVGPRNDEVIGTLAGAADLIIAAWGAMSLARARAREVVDIIAESTPERHPRLSCFGITRSGAPKHPLYLPNGTPLVRYHLREDR